jgi:hypothetical protein
MKKGEKKTALSYAIDSARAVGRLEQAAKRFTSIDAAKEMADHSRVGATEDLITAAFQVVHAAENGHRRSR